MSDKEVKDTASTQEPKEGKPPRKKSTYIIIGILIIVVALLGVVIYMLLNKDKPEKDNRGTVVTEKNAEEVKEQISQPVQDGYYQTSMTIDWTFDTAAAVSKDAFVENVKDNNRTVYFDVNLQDSQELVYSSPYIPIGESLSGIKLSKELAPGDYPAIVTYHLVDDEHNEVSKLAVGITLHILN